MKLLSFGGDEDGEEEEEVVFKKKPIVRPDRMCRVPLHKYRMLPRLLTNSFTVIDSSEISSAISPAISQAPKEKPTKVKGTSESKSDVPEKAKSKKDDDDITKIRAKHAQELTAQRWDIV